MQWKKNEKEKESSFQRFQNLQIPSDSFSEGLWEKIEVGEEEEFASGNSGSAFSCFPHPSSSKKCVMPEVVGPPRDGIGDFRSGHPIIPSSTYKIFEPHAPRIPREWINQSPPYNYR